MFGCPVGLHDRAGVDDVDALLPRADVDVALAHDVLGVVDVDGTAWVRRPWRTGSRCRILSTEASTRVCTASLRNRASGWADDVVECSFSTERVARDPSRPIFGVLRILPIRPRTPANQRWMKMMEPEGERRGRSTTTMSCSALRHPQASGGSLTAATGGGFRMSPGLKMMSSFERAEVLVGVVDPLVGDDAEGEEHARRTRRSSRASPRPTTAACRTGRRLPYGMTARVSTIGAISDDEERGVHARPLQTSMAIIAEVPFASRRDCAELVARARERCTQPYRPRSCAKSRTQVCLPWSVARCAHR